MNLIKRVYGLIKEEYNLKDKDCFKIDYIGSKQYYMDGYTFYDEKDNIVDEMILFFILKYGILITRRNNG